MSRSEPKRKSSGIFFKDKGSAVDATHVGLVRYSDGNYVYTVEGNTSNGSEYSSNGEYVALKAHKLSSSYIVGYATPKYGENKTWRRVDYSGSFKSCGDYICDSDITVFSDEALTVASGKTISAFSLFRVTKTDRGYFKVSFDGDEGYIPVTLPVTQITTTETVYIVNYVNESGSQMYMPQYRRAGQTKDAYANRPSRADCGFVGWTPSSDPSAVIAPGAALPEYNGDITLTALWDTNTYTVSFNNSDGTLFYQTSGFYGTEYDIPTPPTAPDGFVFYGWGEEIDGVITRNATYTAEFISEEELNAALATETETDAQKNEGCSSSVGGIAILAASVLSFAIFHNKKK